MLGRVGTVLLLVVSRVRYDQTSMSKAEIIAGLASLTPEDRAEVQAKLDELAGDAWQDRGELTEADKQALDAELADYAASPEAGSSWPDVKARVQSMLRPS
jgi:hypothetical protein